MPFIPDVKNYETKKFEGFSPKIYKDTAGKRTIGYGFNIDDPAIKSVISPDIIEGKREISQQEADNVFDTLYSRAKTDAIKFIGKDTFDVLPPKIQETLTDMSYNLGYNRLSTFKKFKSALKEGDMRKAAEELKDSKWFDQVGDRAKSHYETLQKTPKLDLSFLNPFKTNEAFAEEIPKEKPTPSFISDTKVKPTSSFLPDKPQKNISQKIFGEGFGTGEFDRMSGLGKFIDIISRPSYAVKSGIKELQKPMFEPRQTEVLKSMWKGFTGQERATANEILEKAGIKGVPGLGFITEVAWDPLTFGAGAVTKGVTKGVEATGKVAMKIPAVVGVTTKVNTAIEPAVTLLKKSFSRTSGIPQLDNLINKYTLEREYLKGQEFKYGVKVRNEIQNIAKKTGRSIDDISQEVVNLIELPETIKSALPETKILAGTLKTHFSDLLTKEMKAGVPVTALSENTRGIQYFPRITTDAAKQYLKQAKIGNSKIWNPKIANALKRKTGDFTLEEFNSFVKEHGLSSLGGRSVEEFFMKNPAYAVAMRGMRSAKSITSAQFLDETGKIFGQVAERAPRYWEEAPETLQKILPSLKGKKFDPTVLSEINRVYTKIINPQEVGGFLKVFDTVQNYWKRWTLMPFAKYHIRNVVGNVWNNYLAGVVNPEDYIKAAQLQEYSKTGKIGALKTLGKQYFSPEQATEILNQADKYGVTVGTQYVGDIPQAIEREISVKGLKKFAPTRIGGIVGKTLEDNSRLAHFVNKLESGMKADEAAVSVKKFLFDYNDISPFEKQIMKRVAPFYTWTRKNLPLQLEQVWKQPQKYVPIEKWLMNRDEKDLLRLKYSKPYLYERLPIELKRNIDSVTYVPMEGLIPAADLGKIVRPQEILFELLSPYIKTPIELGINKSFYTEQEIQRYPQETQEFLRMDIPVKWKYAITSITPQARMLNSINTIVRKKEKSLPLTPEEQIFEHGLGKVYKEDINELRTRAIQKIQRKVSDLKGAYRWAIIKKRPNEAKRILNTINQVIGELKNL